jgi:hypothetical protein
MTNAARREIIEESELRLNADPKGLQPASHLTMQVLIDINGEETLSSLLLDGKLEFIHGIAS